MRSIARSCLVAFLVVGLLDLPVAATDNAVGTVIQAETAHLGNISAAVGTTVYPGDVLSTETGGTLRLRVGAGQVYLLSSSAAVLRRDTEKVQAKVTRGTVGFSTPASSPLELWIPQGVVRAADGQPAHGQVTLVSPTEAVISGYRGALILDNAGDIHTIGAGSSYRVTILPDDTDAAQKPEGAGTEPEVKFYPQKRRRLLVALIILGVVGVSSFFIAQELTESPSKPK